MGKTLHLVFKGFPSPATTASSDSQKRSTHTHFTHLPTHWFLDGSPAFLVSVASTQMLQDEVSSETFQLQQSHFLYPVQTKKKVEIKKAESKLFLSSVASAL